MTSFLNNLLSFSLRPLQKKKKIILENERQMFDLAHSPGTEKRNYKCFALIIREQRHQQN